MAAYNKPPLFDTQLVNKLLQRGLLIPDEPRAKKYLNTIGYYRLSAYFSPFQSSQDVFIPGTSFDDILGLYIFDRKLRLLFLDPIQRIEVAVRAAISNYMSLKYDAYWYLESKLFSDKRFHHNFVSEIYKNAGKTNPNNHVFCKHYFDKYGDNIVPPSWMVIEVLTMGSWSKLFANLGCSQDQRTIASYFNFSKKEFINWLRNATLIRNSIAHHMRFWNAEFPFSPNLTKYATLAGPATGPYSKFVVVLVLLNTIVNKSRWNIRLKEHIRSCPLDVIQHMSFPVDWDKLPYWN